jgi:hypothetical protein
MNVVIDLNRLTYRAWRDFVDAGDEADEIEMLTRVVAEWDLPGDPSDPASYDALGMIDMLTVQQALRSAIAEATGSSASPGN